MKAKYILLNLVLVTIFVTIFLSCSFTEADDIPPLVDIIYPDDGQAVSSTVKIVIGATDNEKVTNLNLYIDGNLAVNLKEEPFEYLWDTTPIADNRDHSLFAVASDKQGNVTFSGATTVRVVAGILPDTLAPVINIVNPVTGSTVQDTVLIIPQIQDDGIIDEVEYFIDGRSKFSTQQPPFEYPWIVSSLINGSEHNIFARAFDENRNSSYSNVVTVTVSSPIIVDNTAPTVAISYPTYRLVVSDTVDILASAQDNVGIDRLELFVDGQLHSTITQTPWRFQLDVSGMIDNSTHTIFIIAFDTNQNQAISNLVEIIIDSENINDTTAPTVFISFPSFGSVLSGVATIVATANDNLGVNNVEFYIDGLLAGNDAQVPFEYSWDVTSLVPGSSHTLYCKAYDGAGNNAQSALLQVSIKPEDIIPPTIDIIFPNAGAIITEDVTITAEAEDETGISKVDFFIDGQLVSSDASAPYTYDWQIGNLTNNSSHTILAKAFDTTGNFGNSGLITVTVQNQDVTPPSVTILYPSAGIIFSAGAIVAISVDAQDNVGVEKVEFFIDGQLLSTDLTAPYGYNWDTSPYGDGQLHSIYVKAYDVAGNTGTQLITVTINP